MAVIAVAVDLAIEVGAGDAAASVEIVGVVPAMAVRVTEVVFEVEVGVLEVVVAVVIEAADEEHLADMVAFVEECEEGRKYS